MLVDEKTILKELVFLIRNNDVLSNSIRNVVTVEEEGVISGDLIVINRSNVKNIRVLKINNVNLKFGFDYFVNFVNDTCEIKLNNNHNGDYYIKYDYGSDKIFEGYPRSDLSINSYPRISVEIINVLSEPVGLGNNNINTYDISIGVYAFNKDEIRDYIKKIRDLLIINHNKLYSIKLIKPRMIGPIIIGESEKFKDKIFQRNLDVRGFFNLEVNEI